MPMLAAELDRLAVANEGGADRLEHARGERGGGNRLLGPDLQDGELVAAQSRHDIAAAYAVAQALADGLEDLVAAGMAERIVDILEAIEIERQHRHGRTALGLVEFLAQALAQVQAVGQIGQRIVVGEVRHAGLDAPLLGDVLVHGDPAAARHRLMPQDDTRARP